MWRLLRNTGPENPKSILSGTAPIKRESEHIFFDLPQKTEMLENFLKPFNYKNR